MRGENPSFLTLHSINFGAINFFGGDFVEVIKRAVVKQVLTEKSKDQLLKKLETEKKRCLNECEQLDFEKRKAIKYQVKKNHKMIIERFEEEIERRQEKVRSLDFQIEQLHILQYGTEIVEKEIETIEHVNVGDDWERVMKPSVIVIKDGQVIEIR